MDLVLEEGASINGKNHGCSDESSSLNKIMDKFAEII